MQPTCGFLDALEKLFAQPVTSVLKAADVGFFESIIVYKRGKNYFETSLLDILKFLFEEAGQ